MSAFNHNIKLIRALTGKKQLAFAELIKSNKSNIKTWETTDTLPTDILIYRRLADLAGVSEHDIRNKALTEKDITLKVDKVDESNSVLPLGDLHVTLKDYVELLKDRARKAEEREKEYLEIIKSKLISIDANSKEMAEDIEALTTEIQAEHRAMMDTMDVAAGQPIGTTFAKADSVEIASQQQRVGKGKQTGIDKNVATDKKR
jgi:hypothetical protein